jgi:hypothetical protein
MLKYSITPQSQYSQISIYVTPPHSRVMDAWLNEIHYTASMCAMTLKELNATSEQLNRNITKPLSSNLPAEPSVFPAIAKGLLQLPADCLHLIPIIGRAYSQLTDTKELTWELFDSFEQKSNLKRIKDSFQGVHGRWLQICAVFADAVVDLERSGIYSSPEGRENDSKLCRNRSIQIVQALRQAMAGMTDMGSAGVDLSGRLPSPLQRRRWLRHDVNFQGEMTINGRTDFVQIKNVSAGGALLYGTGFIQRGTKLDIATASGRVFNCISCWSSAGATGVKFETPLELTDQILRLN